MTTFSPRTFSAEWEIMLLDRLERLAGWEVCDVMASSVRDEFGLPVSHEGGDRLEFRFGVNRCLDEMWQRVHRVTDRAREIAANWDLDLLLVGVHPLVFQINGTHVHVGTVNEEAPALEVKHRALRYMPAFGALAANSPICAARAGTRKSHRLVGFDAGPPMTVRDIYLSQPTWEEEAAPRLTAAPTVEVRVMDTATSRRLFAEIAVFVAAFVHYCAESEGHYECTPDEYRDALTNHWAAARDGMQATFHWDGKLRPVAHVLEEMLDESRDALAKLGAVPSDLRLVKTCIAKRVCQADAFLGLIERYHDPFTLASAYAKLCRSWEYVDEFLEQSPAIEPRPAPDRRTVLDEHLAFIGEGTTLSEVRNAMHYPEPHVREIVQELEDEGTIRQEFTVESGLLLHRKD